MNACARAVVRAGAEAGQEVIGIMRGYQGLLEEDFFVASDGRPHMTARSVSNLAPKAARSSAPAAAASSRPILA